jgi:hypothetical protein
MGCVWPITLSHYQCSLGRPLYSARNHYHEKSGMMNTLSDLLYSASYSCDLLPVVSWPFSSMGASKSSLRSGMIPSDPRASISLSQVVS